MTISDDEIQARLDSLRAGPWSGAVVEAKKIVAMPNNFRPQIVGGRILLDAAAMTDAGRRRSAKLRTLLRPHFESEFGITSPAEQRKRDMFDLALTQPQLYELALQSGYLPEPALRQPAQQLLTDLLWSKPARRFVEAYDYLAIPMLAARVGVEGLANVSPPEPDAGATVRFAGFLAHLRAFHEDDDISLWTAFLDDYVDANEDDEREQLWGYLRGKHKRAPNRASSLLFGCRRFVTSLASAFDMLEDAELGKFGLMHAYWLQKFFGYHVVESGYAKDTDIWGKSDSWAHAIANSPRLLPDDVSEPVAHVARKEFIADVGVLEKTFTAVRALARSTRTGSGTPGKTHEPIVIDLPSMGADT